MSHVPNIGFRRELFVDDFLIAETNGAVRRLHAPERREIVLAWDDPHFARAGFHNLMHDNGRIRLYYRGVTRGALGASNGEPAVPAGQEKQDGIDIPIVMGREQAADKTTTHYAESTDGVHFDFPELRLIEWRGSKRNNIILTGHDAQNFCVFRDDNPAAPAEERYKAVGGDIEPPTIAGPKLGLRVYTSPDGIHWTKKPGLLDVTGMFDSLNVPFWDAVHQCYRLFSRFTEFRYATPQDQWPNYCRRDIQHSQSADFIHWSAPQLHAYTPGDYDEQYYTNATQPCPGAEHIFLSFPMRFVEHRTKLADAPYPGVSDTVFMASRDGHHWTRHPEAYLRPDLDPRNWISRGSIMASGIIPTAEHEWSQYIGERYFSTANCLRRLAVRPWGFASLYAGASGGTVVTRPFRFDGDRIRLNYATSAAGSVRIGILSESATPIDGFAPADMDLLFGNELDRMVTWHGRGDVGSLAGAPIRLRFELNDADVFAFRTAAEWRTNGDDGVLGSRRW